MIHKFLENVFNFLVNLVLYNTLSFKKLDGSIKYRMKYYLSKYNSNTISGEKPYVISIKSNELSHILKRLDNIEDKITKLRDYGNKMFRVVYKFYEKFDPTLVYCFNNEIHIVYNYEHCDTNKISNGNFGGNIHKLITSTCSFISSGFSREMQKDIIFTGTFVEFNQEYEVLNYLIWRQNDCIKNTISCLYKCNNVNKIQETNADITQKVCLNDMYNQIRKYNVDDLILGDIYKKQIQKLEEKNEVTQQILEKDIIVDKNLQKPKKIFTLRNIDFSIRISKKLEDYIYYKYL